VHVSRHLRLDRRLQERRERAGERHGTHELAHLDERDVRGRELEGGLGVGFLFFLLRLGRAQSEEHPGHEDDAERNERPLEIAGLAKLHGLVFRAARAISRVGIAHMPRWMRGPATPDSLAAKRVRNYTPRSVPGS